MKADKKENNNVTKLYLQSLKMFWDSNTKFMSQIKTREKNKQKNVYAGQCNFFFKINEYKCIQLSTNNLTNNSALRKGNFPSLL